MTIIEQAELRAKIDTYNSVELTWIDGLNSEGDDLYEDIIETVQLLESLPYRREERIISKLYNSKLEGQEFEDFAERLQYEFNELLKDIGTDIDELSGVIVGNHYSFKIDVNKVKTIEDVINDMYDKDMSSTDYRNLAKKTAMAWKWLSECDEHHQEWEEIGL